MGHEAADPAEGAVGDVEVAVEHREDLGLDGELPRGCCSHSTGTGSGATRGSSSGSSSTRRSDCATSGRSGSPTGTRSRTTRSRSGTTSHRSTATDVRVRGADELAQAVDRGTWHGGGWAGVGGKGSGQ